MQTIKNAVICAAGIGSRLGLNRAKCMIDIMGKTLLEYHLERLVDLENIWIVVGFQEDDVIAEAKRLRPDCIIVRNPDYMKTNTLQSVWRVSRHLKEKFLVIDADTVIENKSFAEFLADAERTDYLIGISPYTTSDGVRVKTDAAAQTVTAFTRDAHYDYEWTGIAVIDPRMVINEPVFVYQSLEKYLPIRSFNINAFDIDTIADLDMAKKVTTAGWV